MHNEPTIDEIIVNYLNGPLSEKETAVLDQWLREPGNRQLFEEITQPRFLSEELHGLYVYDENQRWEKIRKKLSRKQVSISGKRRWLYGAAAACLAGAMLVTGYIYFNKKDKPVDRASQYITRADVLAPVKTKARIQLDNGQTVSLDSIGSGTLAKQGNVKVIKASNGEIIYSGAATEITYNTLVNPRGGTVVWLVLSDGTKVWLNSESSLRYPTAFTGAERNVQVTGEAYFEVAKNPAKKFIVTGNGVRTEVLGTHFNINTYQDESATRVTLLEGSVKVQKAGSEGLLKPGEQAAFSNNSQQMTVSETDADKVIAWKTGDFNFDDDDLPSVMRQLARWYDLDVVYEGSIPKDAYSGLINRQLTLLQVLNILNVAGINYAVEGKKITIQNKK
jgi:transmembrane sensor